MFFTVLGESPQSELSFQSRREVVIIPDGDSTSIWGNSQIKCLSQQPTYFLVMFARSIFF